jgi:glycosyltransferase involved in cell wall biosynthesis
MEFVYGINILLKSRNDIDVKIVGIDKVFYDDSTTSYQTLALEVLGDNMQHVEFMGHVSSEEIVKLFSISDLHIYYTQDFALSWSFIEALMSGCIVLGSSTEPVKEFIIDGVNGFLVNPSDFMTFRDKVNTILSIDDKPKIRKNAHESVKHLTRDNCSLRWRLLIDSMQI